MTAFHASVLTLFPESLTSIVDASILGRARKAGILAIDPFLLTAVVLGVVFIVARLYGIGLFGMPVVPGYTSTIVSIVFLGGVQLVCLGLLGEYIGRARSKVDNPAKRFEVFWSALRPALGVEGDVLPVGAAQGFTLRGAHGAARGGRAAFLNSGLAIELNASPVSVGREGDALAVTIEGSGDGLVSAEQGIACRRTAKVVGGSCTVDARHGETVVLKAMAKHPEDRYPSAALLAGSSA